MDGTFQQLAAGELTPVTCALYGLTAAILGGAGGCIGANFLGGKSLGKELTFMMGFPFGVAVAVPGVLIGLLVSRML